MKGKKKMRGGDYKIDCLIMRTKNGTREEKKKTMKCVKIQYYRFIVLF